MDKRFAPRPGRLGVHPVIASSGVVASPTANTTTSYMIGLPPGKFYVSKLAALQNTVIVDADGTALVTFYKYKASDDSSTALNTAVNLESSVTKETQPITVLATLTDAERTIDAENGDAIYCSVVSNSAAIDTAATGLNFIAEVLYLL